MYLLNVMSQPYITLSIRNKFTGNAYNVLSTFITHFFRLSYILYIHVVGLCRVILRDETICIIKMFKAEITPTRVRA